MAQRLFRTRWQKIRDEEKRKKTEEKIRLVWVFRELFSRYSSLRVLKREDQCEGTNENAHREKRCNFFEKHRFASSCLLLRSFSTLMFLATKEIDLPMDHYKFLLASVFSVHPSHWFCSGQKDLLRKMSTFKNKFVFKSQTD